MSNKKCNVSHETLFLLTKTLFLLVILISSVLPIQMKAYEDFGFSAKANILISAESKVILAGQNIDEQLAIASLTKIMSAYVIFDQIEQQKLDPTTIDVPISDMVVDLSLNPELSGVVFNNNTTEKMDVLIELMLVYSDNGATIALSDYLFGSEVKAVEAMNKKAEDLGLEKTYFYNVSGLTMSDYGSHMLPGTKATDYNVSTAREQSIIVWHYLDDYPEDLEISSIPSVTYNGYELNNYNSMLPGLAHEYEGVLGMKTGTSVEAGACFAGYYIDPATNEAYISVVLGSRDADHRFEQTAYMYDWVKETVFEPIIPKTLAMKIDLRGDNTDFVALNPTTQLLLPEGTTSQFMLKSFDYNDKYFDENNYLKDNIPAGEVVATGIYEIPIVYDSSGNESENLKDIIQVVDQQTGEFKVSFVSQEEIKKGSFLERGMYEITQFYKSLFNSLKEGE